MFNSGTDVNNLMPYINVESRDFNQNSNKLNELEKEFESKLCLKSEFTNKSNKKELNYLTKQIEEAKRKIKESERNIYKLNLKKKENRFNNSINTRKLSN